ncbi:MAG: hypothetical protein SGJ15_02065 [Bacteroidota bacterium]|nr:hypothetical protein [Bacteroidota bacterium]
MRRGFIILVFLYACTSEPKGVIYEFKMINGTDSDYVVNKHYRYSNVDAKTDTLFARSEMSFSVPRVGSYGQSFGDSLINSFFDTLIVKMINTKKQINVSNRSNWEERSEFDQDFLEKSGSVKGKVIYTLKIGS